MPSTVYLPITKPSNPSWLSEKHTFGHSALGFHTDVGVEVDAGHLDDLPLLAVVTGELRVHRDPPTSSTVTVTLMAHTQVQNDLSKLVGANVVLLVYRQVSTQSVKDTFSARISLWRQKQIARGKTVKSLADLLEELVKGTFDLNVSAGSVIGKVAPSSDPAVTPHFGFEIDYLPNGLLGASGFKRAIALIDPTNTATRRFDPTTFFKTVEAGSHSELVLASSHSGHALLSKLSKHVLLELRNEYNEPYAGSVELTVSGFDTVVTIPASNRGMLRFSGATTLGVAISDRVLTELPSGRTPERKPTRALTLPSHWSLQYVYMKDKDDSENWFVKTPSAMPRYTQGNRVTPLLDGLPTFREIVPAIKQAKASGHTLRMGNWFMDHKLELLPGNTSSSLKEMLLAAAANDVQVTALLWQGTAHGHATNGSSSWFINHKLQDSSGQRIGFSIMDNTYPNRGSHHQKFLVVNGAKGAIAFCGGIDYRLNRLDDADHNALEGYHDTHAKVEGPAVADLHTTFTERWNHHKKITKSGSVFPTLPTLPAPAAAGNQFVQVTHTYAPKYGYVFRPAGELGKLNAMRRAIQRAQRFIYFEDQYVTPYASDKIDGSDDTLHILTDLLAALDRIEFLLIVMPNHAEAPYNRRFRYQFIRALKHKGGAKVRLFYLARPSFVPQGTAPAAPIANETEFAMLSQGTTIKPQGGSGGKKYRDEIFVHSKIWVIDDIYAKVGTANVNRRGATYDSEVDLHVIDGALDRGARSMALGLRVQAWAEHLRFKGADIARLDDPVHALKYWDRLVGKRIKTYDEESEGGKGGLSATKKAVWNSTVDPDGR